MGEIRIVSPGKTGMQENLCHNLVILMVNDTVLETKNLHARKKIRYVSGLTKLILIFIKCMLPV